jgi:hypothetical protein
MKLGLHFIDFVPGDARRHGPTLAGKIIPRLAEIG